MEYGVGKGYSNGIMGKYFKDNGGMGLKMGLVNGKHLKVTTIKENGSIIGRMAKEYSNML